ncbi:TPR repeat-containing thioredoxin TDX isoform X2 [Silene latifolia]|uniref:TPR repeat-containing thioredoxin TDX isoform X2 n=1 Tax=Silene latifolia TaxID=37657 RepID=UPI003D787290
MEREKIADLKLLIDQFKSHPSLLHTPSLHFFRNYVQSLGAAIPPDSKSSSHVLPDDESEDEIVESDIELDETDVVEPDDEPPLSMGDPSAEVSDEDRDMAQTLKSKALVVLGEGQLDEALGLLTEAIILNPCSAMLYATRGTALLKLKKPNAAVQDANTALQINPDSAKAYKVRGMAKAMLGKWEDAGKDLQIASKLDYDVETDSVLRKVESNTNKIDSHRRKYERLRNERELKKIEWEKQQQHEAQDM